MKRTIVKTSTIVITLTFMVLTLVITVQARRFHRGGSTVYYSIDRACTDGVEITLADSRGISGPIAVELYADRLYDGASVLETDVAIPEAPIEIPGVGTWDHGGTFSISWDLALDPGTRVSLDPFISGVDIVSWHTIITNCKLDDGARIPERFLFVKDTGLDWSVPPPGNDDGGPDCRPGIDVNTTTLEITEDIVIDDLNVAMHLTHDASAAHLEAILTSPQGTAVTLIPRGTDREGFGQKCDWISEGLVSHDMANFVLDDDSIFELDDTAITWQSIYSAWKIPGPGSLSAFTGENAAGTWTLDVCDTVPEDQGYLWCWDLEILVDRRVSFAKDSYEVSESAGSVAVDIELSTASREMTEVNYTTIPATGSNQQVTSGKVQFAPRSDTVPGQRTKQISIPIVDDPNEEADEVMLIKLSNPTNEFATAEPYEAQIIIRDDDAPGTATLMVNVDGNGSVAKSPDKTVYAIGEEVTLTAEPDPGHIFQSWSGDLSGSQNPAQLTMDGDRTVLAAFKPETIDGISAYFLPSIVRP